jgi:hypothetical protein
VRRISCIFLPCRELTVVSSFPPSEYKSFVQPVSLSVPFRFPLFLADRVSSKPRFLTQYIDEQLTPPQRENHQSLLSDLNTNLLTYLGRNRFPHLSGSASLAHLRSLSQVGPFSASRAQKEGLVDGVCYRQDVLDAVQLNEQNEDAGVKLFGFYHYAKVLERGLKKVLDDTIEVGVVYLLGGIGDPGGTSAFLTLLFLVPFPLPRTHSSSLSDRVRNRFRRPWSQGSRRRRHHRRCRPPHRLWRRIGR